MYVDINFTRFKTTDTNNILKDNINMNYLWEKTKEFDKVKLDTLYEFKTNRQNPFYLDLKKCMINLDLIHLKYNKNYLQELKLFIIY